MVASYLHYLETLATIRSITGSLVVDDSGRYYGQTWDKEYFKKPETIPSNVVYELGFDTKYGRTLITIPESVKLVYTVDSITVTIDGVTKLMKFAKDYEDGESPHRMFIVSGDPFNLQNKSGQNLFFEVSW